MYITEMGHKVFLKKSKNLIFASTHEMPLFPGTGYKEETGLGNIINEPIAPSLDGKSFLKIWQNKYCLD